MPTADALIAPPAPGLLWMIGVIFAGLLAGSGVRFFSLRGADQALRRKRFASLRTWWIVAAVVAAGLLAGRAGICALLAAAGIIAFREYANLLGVYDTDRPLIRAVYGIAVLHYLLIFFEQATAFLAFVPVGGLAILVVCNCFAGIPGDTCARSEDFSGG